MSTDAQDIAVARQLRQAGIATPEQIAQGLALQGKALEKGEAISLAEALVRSGVITPAIRDNLEKQLKSQQGKVLQLLHYRLLKKLGEGGMGAVYLAEDTRSRLKVAVKVLPRKNSADDEFVKRFRREVEAATKPTHSLRYPPTHPRTSVSVTSFRGEPSPRPWPKPLTALARQELEGISGAADTWDYATLRVFRG